MCANFIKRFVHSLPLNHIFTTREVLIHGSRNTVDQTLWKLVKAGRIIRLTRGVFIKDGSTIPDAYSVAQAKYQAHGKQIARHGAYLAAQLEQEGKEANIITELNLAKPIENQVTFTTTGRTSSFKFGNILVRIKGISHRKMLLNQTKLKQAIAALWYMGKDQYYKDTFAIVRKLSLRRDQKLSLKLLRPLMPEWLGKYFVSRSYLGDNLDSLAYIKP